MTETNDNKAEELPQNCCATCNAALSVGPNTFACRANPPVPLMVGVEQNPITGAQKPVVQSYFPPMQGTGWCRQWQPKKGGA